MPIDLHIGHGTAAPSLGQVAPQRLDLLSHREQEVLALVSAGSSNLAIALGLFVTGRTIETHIRSILLKLDVPDTPDVHRRVLLTRAYLDGLGSG